VPAPVEELEDPVCVPALCLVVGRDGQHSKVKRLQTLESSPTSKVSAQAVIIKTRLISSHHESEGEPADTEAK
jgi:hypothetical protein